ncbi:hypothetical protein [Bdellovibrio bacteriovorus]|uniref:hypothetical protein n=1 Tax=Bdellovibrio bacteriovorus TaxID=959 RepID=UPI0035A945E7
MLGGTQSGIQREGKMYGPSFIYDSYFDFLKRRIGSKKLLVSIVIPITLVSLMAIFKIVSEATSFDRKFDLLLIGLIFAGVFYAILLLATYSMWKERFEIKGNRIYDYFPFQKVYEVRWIERVVLNSPNSAQILIRDPNRSLMSGVYWFGRSKQDWLDFVNLLQKINPEISNRIYVNSAIFKNENLKKVSLENSYDEISKVYSGPI